MEDGRELIRWADTLAEAMMDEFTHVEAAEDLADQIAESAVSVFGMDGDDDAANLAEGLAHLGCGPDEIGDAIHTALHRLAGKAALRIARGPLPEAMPTDAAEALARMLAVVKRREA